VVDVGRPTALLVQAVAHVVKMPARRLYQPGKGPIIRQNPHQSYPRQALGNRVVAALAAVEPLRFTGCRAVARLQIVLAKQLAEADTLPGTQQEPADGQDTFRVVTRGADGRFASRLRHPRRPAERHVSGVDDCSTDLGFARLPVFRGLIGPMPEAERHSLRSPGSLRDADKGLEFGQARTPAFADHSPTT